MEVDLTEEGHTACPECQKKGRDKAGDNLMVYGEGQGAWCFSCGFTIPSDEYKENDYTNTKGINMLKPSDLKKLQDKAFTVEQLKEFQDKTVSRISVRYRGLDNDVCEELGVRWSVDNEGKPTAMHYPATVTEDGEDLITGYKSRGFPKDFYSTGYVGKANGFIGDTGAVAETLIIVSGEVDLVSAKMGMALDKYRKSYNIVSALLGEDSTASTIKMNYDWVNSHKKIISCMDNDDAGEAAFEKIQSVVDSSKLFRANLKYKDCNEYIKNKDINSMAAGLYWDALPCKTFGITSSSNMFDKMLEVIDVEKIPIPPFLCGLDEALAGGIALGEVLNIVSSVSTGKTSFINSILMHWIMHSPHRILIISLEDNIASYTMKLSSRVSGINIAALRTSEEKHEVLNKNRKEIESYLVDENGSSRFDIMEKVPPTLDELKEAIIQAIKVNGVRLIILDPLVSLIGTKSLDEQGEWMLFEEETRRDYSCTWVNICHVRKSGSGEKAHSEGGNFSEESIKGSSQISATATTNILLRRNKMSDDPIERNTTYVSISKNRATGITGADITKVYYSNATQLMTDFNYAQENNFFEGLSSQEVRSMMDTTKSAVEVENIQEIDDVEVIDIF